LTKLLSIDDIFAWGDYSMKRVQDNLFDGIIALPSFPVVLVTVDRNIMAVSF